MQRLNQSWALLIAGLASVTGVSTACSQGILVDGELTPDVARVIRLKTEDIATRTVENVSEKAEKVTQNFTAVGERLASNPLAPAARVNSPFQIDSEVIGSDQAVAKPAASSGFQPASRAIQKATTKQPATTPQQSLKAEPRTSVTAGANRSQAAPVLATEVTAPEYINLNEVASMQIAVRNNGKTQVDNVRLFAQLPDHATYSGAAPEPITNHGEYEFVIDRIAPGQSRQIRIDVVPTEKRPLEISTRVVMESSQTVAVGVRQPQLSVTIDGPMQVNVGSPTKHTVTIHNTGDGTAREVRLEANFPDQLQFVEQTGMNQVQTIEPGKKVEVIVKSLAVVAGDAELDFSATGTGCEAEPAAARVHVAQPELKVSAAGPEMNFVDRDGIYSIAVENTGEVDVDNVTVQLSIPTGMKVTTISRQAKVNERSGTLDWTFPQIKSQSSEMIQLKATATKSGDQICRIKIDSDQTREKEVQLTTVVSTRAELSVDTSVMGGPIQVGDEANFLVRIENRGTQVAKDIRVQVEIPQTMRPVDQVDGFVEESQNSILFMENALKPGDTREFKFSTLGVAAGEQVVRTILQTESSQQRIITENSVYIYEPVQARVSESLTPSIPR